MVESKNVAASSGRAHETRVAIDAPIEEVWKAITEAEAIARWFAPKMTVEPGAGGFVLADFGPGMESQDGAAIVYGSRTVDYLDAGP